MLVDVTFGLLRDFDYMINTQLNVDTCLAISFRKDTYLQRGIYLSWLTSLVATILSLELLTGTLYHTLLFIVPYSLHKSLCCAYSKWRGLALNLIGCERTSSLNWRLFDMFYICL